MDTDSFDQTIPTIIAREVKGETPQWYDPNDYHKYARIVDARSGESFLIDVDQAVRLDIRNVNPEERANILKQCAIADGMVRNNGRTGARTVSGATPNRIIRQVVRDNRQAQNAIKPRDQISPPQCVVEFRLLGVPAKFTCYYLDVLEVDRYLILVQDIEAVIGQQIELDPGAEVRITVPARGIADINYMSLGLSFDYENRRFSILVKSEGLIDEEPQFPEVTAQENSDPEKDLESVLVDLETRLAKRPVQEPTSQGSDR